mgnify:FL=1
MSLLVRDLVKMGETQLKKAGCPDPKNDAEILYCYMRNIDRNQFIMEWSEIVDDRICDKYFDLIAERSTRRPLQHITGTQNIMGLEFGIREDVLIPRMDTEALIGKAEEIIKKKGKASVLDICCGSGCVGISLAARNKGVKLTMADISPAAKALAEANAKKFGIKTDVLLGDLFAPVKKKYHIIVSNPPYIPSAVLETLEDEVKRFEPKEALDGGALGLDFYERIIKEAPLHLKKEGWLVLEIGHDQAAQVRTITEETNLYEEYETAKDLAGKTRVFAARIKGKR